MAVELCLVIFLFFLLGLYDYRAVSSFLILVCVVANIVVVYCCIVCFISYCRHVRQSSTAQQQRDSTTSRPQLWNVQAPAMQWSWCDDYGSYIRYPEDISQMLTQAYLRDPQGCLVIRGVNGKGYRVNFYTTTQTNVATGFKRSIKKDVQHQSFSESTVSYPPSWQPQTKTVEVFPVRKGTPEWNRVERIFKATNNNLSIIQIDRIQNTWLWKKYVQHKKMMEEKNSGAVNEMELFHGTRGTTPREIYDSEEGFDMRFSAQGMWGQANYFAVNASYSDHYAHTNTIGEKEIFLASVLTGDSYPCGSDRSLRMPPLKPSTGGVQLHRVRYDTVTGYTGGFQVYMTYDNQKAYPTYLITYL